MEGKTNGHHPVSVESDQDNLYFEYLEKDEQKRGGAKTPMKGSPLAAGYDLFAAQPTIVPAKGKALVSTGLVFKIPVGTYGRVAPRSGLAVKNFIDVGAGVIDADYRGEVKVLLFNFGEEPFEVKPGDRIAQLIIEKIALTKLVKGFSPDNTERGSGGFGSTGTN